MSPYRPEPPAPPRFDPPLAVQHLVISVLLVAAAMLVVLFVVACAGTPALTSAQAASTAAEQAEIASYAAEEQECVARASTRAEADVCIMAVQARWCGDGGALAVRGDCPAQAAGNAARLDAMMRHAAGAAAVSVDAGKE